MSNLAVSFLTERVRSKTQISVFHDIWVIQVSMDSIDQPQVEFEVKTSIRLSWLQNYIWKIGAFKRLYVTLVAATVDNLA